MKNFTIALNEDGEVYSSGQGEYGVLGQGCETEKKLLSLVKFGPAKPKIN